MGLPGDLSSASRFVRVAFTKMNSLSGLSESESVSQFSIFWGAWIRPEDVVSWTKGSMRSLSTLPAAMQTEEFTIIRPMKSSDYCSRYVPGESGQ